MAIYADNLHFSSVYLFGYKIFFLFPLKYLNKAYENLLLPYFFSYKMEFFSFENNPKNLGPSYKMDLDLWDCLGRIKLVL